MECYSALRDGEHLRLLLDAGAQLQPNADEMPHDFLNGMTRWLKKRYAARKVTYIGSDMHNLTDRLPLSIAALRWTDRLGEKYRTGFLCGFAEESLKSRVYTVGTTIGGR